MFRVLGIYNFDPSTHNDAYCAKKTLLSLGAWCEQEGEKNEIKLPANQLGITPKLYIPSTINTQKNLDFGCCLGGQWQC